MLKPFSKTFWRTAVYRVSKFHPIVQLPSPVRTLCDLMNCSNLASLSFTISQGLLKLTFIELLMPSSPTILLSVAAFSCPQSFTDRDFASESSVRIRWSKYWSFSISPSSECAGLISFSIDWFDLAVQRTLVSSLTPVQKHQFFSAQPSLWSNSHIVI